MIRVLQESLAAARVERIHGIVNGTTNFILTEMARGGTSYEAALQRAQELGYAEADPTDDVTGRDAAAKMAILARLAFSTPVHLDQVTYEGIEQITAEVEIGKVYEGPITKILDFGALVNLLPGKDGLLHISQIAHERVEKVTDYLSEGQVVRVKVLETDDKGRVKLSMKALTERPAGMPEEQPRERRERRDDRGERRGDRGERGERGERPAPQQQPVDAPVVADEQQQQQKNDQQ